jgi:hypothetical protein
MIKKIKLIIEVDEKYYEACKDAVKELYPSQIDKVIANGIPYNSTDDLISRSALLKELDEYNEFAVFDCEAVKDIINNAPTISPYKAIHDELHKRDKE